MNKDKTEEEWRALLTDLKAVHDKHIAKTNPSFTVTISGPSLWEANIDAQTAEAIQKMVLCAVGILEQPTSEGE